MRCLPLLHILLRIILRPGFVKPVMVKINHNMLMISCDEKKYPSNTLNRTGKNNYMNHSQGSNEVLSKSFMCA